MGMKTGPGKPVVGATLVVARLRSAYMLIAGCADRKAAWVIPAICAMYSRRVIRALSLKTLSKREVREYAAT